MAPRIALTRALSPAMAACQLTHLPRRTLDLRRARRQHGRYERVLERLGCRVHRLPAGRHLPDSVFIEDTALVFPELAVITRPGACSRRGETDAVARALSRWRRLVEIQPPATLDGGDVVVVARRVLVGLSARTNDAALAQLRTHLVPLGYRVDPIPVAGCLHLKTAVTALDHGTLLLNPAWCDSGMLGDYRLLTVDADEPWAANTLRVDAAVLMAAAFPRTRRRVESAGFTVLALPADELAKAEGGLSCCSLIFEP